MLTVPGPFEAYIADEPNPGASRKTLTLVNLFTAPPGEADAFEAL
jgi:hypothetical protein